MKKYMILYRRTDGGLAATGRTDEGQNIPRRARGVHPQGERPRRDRRPHRGLDRDRRRAGAVQAAGIFHRETVSIVSMTPEVSRFTLARENFLRTVIMGMIQDFPEVLRNINLPFFPLRKEIHYILQIVQTNLKFN